MHFPAFSRLLNHHSSHVIDHGVLETYDINTPGYILQHLLFAGAYFQLLQEFSSRIGDRYPTDS